MFNKIVKGDGAVNIFPTFTYIFKIDKPTFNLIHEIA